jgi:hypothetical protein
MNWKSYFFLALTLIGFGNNTQAASCTLINVGESPKDAPANWTTYCGSSNIDTLYVRAELIIDGEVDWRPYGPITLIVEGTGPFASAMLRFPTGPNRLYLAENSVLILANGGMLEGEPACSNADRIFIGSHSYARCAGTGNAEYLFSDLNNYGGSVRTVVNASPLELCQGGAFSMEALVEGGSPDFRRTELWVKPPNSGSEIKIYGTFPEVTCDPAAPSTAVAPFNITFTYGPSDDLLNYIYHTPGVYEFRARTTDKLCFWHEVTYQIEVYELPEVSLAGDLLACNSTELTPDVITDATTYFHGTSSNSFDESVTGAQTFTSSGTYYFRAKSDFGCWGPAHAAIVELDFVDGGNLNSLGQNFCLGEDVALELDDYIGTIQYWQRETPANSNNWVTIANTTDELLDNPNATDVFAYRVSIEGDGVCPTIYSPIQQIAMNTPISILLNDGFGECDVTGSEWIHLFEPTTNRIIASVNPRGQNLGRLSAEVFYNAGDARKVYSSWGCNNEQAVMNRSFVINSEFPPSSDVNVRLYFTDDELAKLIDLSLSAHSTYPAVSVPHSDPAGCASGDDVRNINELYVTQIHFDATEKAYENGVFDPGIGEFIFHIPVPSSTGDQHFDANYVEITVAKFSEFWLHGSENNSPLPVEMIYFDAQLVENKVVLDWATATEVNNEKFEIERSTDDGATFIKIGEVNGSGNTNFTTYYTFEDQRPMKGLNYYRLKQVDFDGTFAYSEIRAVNVNESIGLSVFPNPATDIVHLTADGITSNQIMITDGMGRLVRDMLITQKNTDLVVLDVQYLPSGMYFINYNGESHKLVVR